MPNFRVIATASSLYPVNMEAMAEGLGGIAETGTVALPHPKELPKEQEDEVVAALESANALPVRIGTVTARLLDRLPCLKAIALHGVGVDQVDVAATTERGIWVSNTPARIRRPSWN